ncbi:hypothetical protein S7711_10452 [Stachybotrys chartarum IBT 7711]|uniref:Uncharacterized protein n=1 Tax=Stachybotrys chartarum (strain CBS 109288 / IBT 7711) TaxID=1280523 RepID=A0A084BBT9_STACB|nr:hypothetical protein S7711_10452 [Stachybotrys chartarum IBT 7711]KFA51915.1 hypothetical protein S40293_10779 [Stachybotrys chartarum IBT 40293]
MSLPDIPCLTNPSHSYKIHRFHPPPSDQPALPLYIPPCLANPPHRLHPPNHDQPLRIQIEGPLLAIQKILPEVSWHVPNHFSDFPMPGGPKLAELAFRTLYGRDVRPDVSRDIVVRDEYRGWLIEARPVVYVQLSRRILHLATKSTNVRIPSHLRMIDYYGVTFDHLVPTDDTNPEVLQINIVEIEDDDGAYANKYNPFGIDPTEYSGKKVLAVPRCCQKRKGTTDRQRVNDAVNSRGKEDSE